MHIPTTYTTLQRHLHNTDIVYFSLTPILNTIDPYIERLHSDIRRQCRTIYSVKYFIKNPFEINCMQAS